MSANECGRGGGGEIPNCPRCKSQDVWRNGFGSAGKQQWRCKTCSRVFVLEPYLSDDIRLIADRMIGSKLPVPQIAIVLAGFVSRRWLYARKGEMING